ncbi:two-component regulator propeller domain-containing protein [uncultured Kordia sp.]|uniref:hybrid sensor histidine kinase/response regulator transcription factor n=1 Tax=uncultured Kordia sp. TaxID=507699 RepID=UPI00262660DE|nr:two-component regulator propeller domain-containing protein [uncultured Kordia sp.]
MKPIQHIFLFLFVVFITTTHAQHKIAFEQLAGNNEYSQSIVYDIKQDSIGNVWIASEEGIAKHNSKTFKFYNTYNGLPTSLNNRITEIFIDSKQQIWAGSEKGICKYNANKDIFDIVDNKKAINPSLVEAFCEDKNNTVWIGGYNGLWKYSPNKSDAQLENVLEGHVIHALHAFNDTIVLGTSKGLYSYDIQTGEVVKIKLDGNPQNISSIVLLKDQLMVGTKTGMIFTVHTKSFDVNSIELSKNFNCPINDFILDDKQNMFIATDGDGLYYTDQKFNILQHYTEDADNPKSISSNGIYDLEFGKRGILWIASYGGGVNYFNSNQLPFENITHELNKKNSLAVNFTRSIAKDNNGKLWFGTKKGTSIYDKKNDSWTHIENLSKKPDNVKDIVLAFEADGDDMWVGTYNNGLYKVNINSLSSERFTAIDDDKTLLKKTYTIYKDVHGNLWFGGIGGYMTILRKNGDLDNYPINNIKAIQSDNEGNIIAAGRNGIYVINDAKKEFKLLEALKPNEKTLAFSTINAVYCTNDNRYILATNGEGLVFYNPKNKAIQKLSIQSGMPSDIIQGILATNDNNLWASTTKGLVQINISEKDTIINTFDKKDGLTSTEFNYGSFAKINTNEFAFGGVDGIVRFDPTKIKGENHRPIIVLEEFKLFNKAVQPGTKILESHINVTDKLTLKSHENSIEIGFTGISHGSSSKLKYSWKLDGFEEEWSTPTATDFATYTNLNSGTYTFRVKASSKYGDFGPERKLQIHIKTAWWASNLAIILYILLGIAIAYTIYHYISVLVKKRNADEQINFLNNITHEIKTPLTILISSLDKVTDSKETQDTSKDQIKTTVKRINSLFEQMLNFHKVTSQETLAQDIQKIALKKHLLQLINDFKPLLSERNLEVELDTEKLQHENFFFDIDTFEKIILNLFSNAIKYSHDNGHIKIVLAHTNNQHLKIDVIDNGIGIPKDQQKFILNRYYRARNVINSQRPGTGLGLIMIKNLVDKIKGTISFVSEENKGTTFTVTLPDYVKEFHDHVASIEDTVEEVPNTIEIQEELEEFSDSKILIVEDNDELRKLLVDTLATYFQVHEAKNGKEGLETASQLFPDIILTDLIMPEMDGMEMARQLKKDINLNHIPVFMMTVLQNSNQKIESLESGISEYIEKPINMKILFAKMINTLKFQKKLHKKYVHESDAENASMFRNKSDQEFLNNLEKTIIENINNSSFSVHDLSASFGMSRTSLYMKLKNLVDLSPQDFIIHTKLKHAKELLIKGDKTIKEVAYSSGFSNPKYFSTSFKKFYKMTPSGFLDSLK